MNVNGEEEHRRTIRVDIADEPAIIHVPHNVFDRIEGMVDMRCVVHGENNAGNDLCNQTEGQNTAKSPPIIDVFRGRIIRNIVMH